MEILFLEISFKVVSKTNVLNYYMLHSAGINKQSAVIWTHSLKIDMKNYGTN